jgi:hypothetical protein
MEFARKCPNCGLDLTEAQGSLCPGCAQRFAPTLRWRIWLGALIQFGILGALILFLRLPRFLIVLFALFGLFAILLGSVLSRKATSARPMARRPVPSSGLFTILSLAIALCGLVFVCFLLFGFVAFINSWNSWHRYQGQPFHRAEFVVEQDYYQPYSKHADLYASGTVEGHREWMDLVPYLHSQNLYRRPHGRDELELLVPPGTSIPIYFFPSLKSRSRVRLYSAMSPAEEYHRAAIKALDYGLCGMGVSALAIFLLIRIRAGYFRQSACDLAPSAGISA